MIWLSGIVLTLLGAGLSAFAHGSVDSDLFMRRLSFALTGSETADIRVIDRSDCVFGWQSEVFRLNAVASDDIRIRREEVPTLFWSTPQVVVELRGKEPIYERNALTYAASDGDLATWPMAYLVTDGAVTGPTETQKLHSKGLTLKFTRADPARIRAAWDYIYSNGCLGTRGSS